MSSCHALLVSSLNIHEPADRTQTRPTGKKSSLFSYVNYHSMQHRRRHPHEQSRRQEQNEIVNKCPLSVRVHFTVG